LDCVKCVRVALGRGSRKPEDANKARPSHQPNTVSQHGKPIERTFDWYAQDGRGNVWYMGEDSLELHHGRFAKASDSWKSAANGAWPGIIVEAPEADAACIYLVEQVGVGGVAQSVPIDGEGIEHSDFVFDFDRDERLLGSRSLALPASCRKALDNAERSGQKPQTEPQRLRKGGGEANDEGPRAPLLVTSPAPRKRACS
jgi:hypothetical protein